MNQAKIVGDGGEVRQKLAHPDPALALLAELEFRGNNELLLAEGHGGDALPLADRFRQWCLEEFVEIWLVIEEVDLARRSGHEKEDHALGLGRMVSAER